MIIIYKNLVQTIWTTIFDRKFDLIIVSDNNAFDFMFTYHKTLFKDIPVLFCGINNFDKALLEKKKKWNERLYDRELLKK